MRIATAVALTLLAAAAGYGISQWRTQSVQMPTQTANPSASSDVQAPAQTAEGAPISGAEATSVRASFVHERPNVATMTAPADADSLPPDSQPLAQSLATLSSAMRNGSREATLRLLRQTKECGNYRGARQQLDFALGVEESNKTPGVKGITVITSGAGAGENSIEGMIKQSADSVAGSEALCAGFEDKDDALRFEAQWRAALMGEVEGLLSFSITPAISVFLAFEQFDRIDRYRERALGFVTQAMTLHSTQAVAQLMNAYDPGWLPLEMRQGSSMPPAMRAFMSAQTTAGPLRQIVGDDAIAAYRYARLCLRVCPEQQRSEAEDIATRLRGELAAADRERAEAEAERLREQHFPDAARADWVAGLGDQPKNPPPGR